MQPIVAAVDASLHHDSATLYLPPCRTTSIQTRAPPSANTSTTTTTNLRNAHAVEPRPLQPLAITPNPTDSLNPAPAAPKPASKASLPTFNKNMSTTLLGGTRLSEGIMTMTNGQQYTAPPPDGFPMPQCVESPWRNTTDQNRRDWAAVKGPKAWVRIYRAKYMPNVRDIVSKLSFVIPRLVEAPELIISPPTSRDDLDERLTAPWNFLLSDIPQASLDQLTNQGLWSTPTISFMVLPFDLPLPNYICTLQNFSLPDSVKSNTIIADAVKAKLKSIKEASDYINKYAETTDTDVAMTTINSIEVKSLEIATSATETDIVWHVYCKPPQMDFFRYLDWCSSVCALTFDTERFGTGVPRMGKDQLFCVGCKSYDHPTGLCPLPRIIGWFGPSVKSVTSEDKTLQRTDERSQPASKKGQNSTKGGRGGKRGGRGGGRRS
ncbi:hypothetical protein C8J57DRAFT_1723036 [Mycena rebaudengoi]|nr:hypothetical protein C8J57DRAFT_1723036 [Mycena rebaudengoi]